VVRRVGRWMRGARRSARRLVRPAAVGLLGFVLACLDSPAGPQLNGEGRRVLFIGNSYLYLQDIPGIVQALADSAGATSSRSKPSLFQTWRSSITWDSGRRR